MVSAQLEMLELAFGYFMLLAALSFIAVVIAGFWSFFRSVKSTIAVVIVGIWSVFRSVKSTPVYKHGVWGGCIEGHYGSRYAKKRWLCTATALEIVNPETPILSVVDDRVLHNLNDMTEAHERNPHVGPLKEHIIKNFPLRYLDDQCKIIIYYMTYIVESGERFHVHVHRGTRMGKKHIDELKSRLEKSGFQCPLDKSLTFGFGYELDQLAPVGSSLPEYYYSISLFVGLDPRMSTGETFIPTNYVHFENAPHLNKKDFFHVENDLSETFHDIDGLEVVSSPYIIGVPTLAIVKGIIIADPDQDFQCIFH